MRPLGRLLALVLLSACSESPAEKVLSRVEESGPQAVIAQLFQSDTEWTELSRNIESGDDAWLRVAASLRPGSDAGSALSLIYSVARAIPANPHGVLSLAKEGHFSIELICTSPFIEPEPGIAERFAEKASEALSTVQDPHLLQVRDECVTRVQLPQPAA